MEIKNTGAQALYDALAARLDLDMRGVSAPQSLLDNLAKGKRTSTLASRKAQQHLDAIALLQRQDPPAGLPQEYLAAVNSGQIPNMATLLLKQKSNLYLLLIEMETLKREAELERYQYERQVSELKPDILKQLHTLRTENAMLKDELAVKKAALGALLENLTGIVKRHGIAGAQPSPVSAIVQG